jgi:predicted  nucleic acid-binding Zn-ribbon protein
MDRSKMRTPQGAFIELAKLSQERERLSEEMERWERRIERIKRRLREIAQAEEWLRKFIEDPAVSFQEERGGFSAEEGRGQSVNAPGFTPMVIRY